MSILRKIPIKNEKDPYRVTEGTVLILDPVVNKIKLLNKIGSAIWELIDGKRKGSDILEIILEEYEVQKEVAEADLIKFIKELYDNNLILFIEEEVSK